MLSANQILTPPFDYHKLEALQHIAENMYSNIPQNAQQANQQLTLILQTDLIYNHIAYILQSNVSPNTKYICLVSYEKSLKPKFCTLSQQLQSQISTFFKQQFIFHLRQTSPKSFILKKLQSILITIYFLNTQTLIRQGVIKQLIEVGKQNYFQAMGIIQLLKGIIEEGLQMNNKYYKDAIHMNIEDMFSFAIMILMEYKKSSMILLQKVLQLLISNAEVLYQFLIPSLQPVINQLLLLFNENLFRSRILEFISILLQNSQSAESITFMYKISTMILECIHNIIPLDVDMKAEREKVDYLGGTKAFDWFVNKVAIFVTNLISKIVNSQIQQKQLFQASIRYVFHLLPISLTPVRALPFIFPKYYPFQQLLQCFEHLLQKTPSSQSDGYYQEFFYLYKGLVQIKYQQVFEKVIMGGGGWQRAKGVGRWIKMNYNFVNDDRKRQMFVKGTKYLLNLSQIYPDHKPYILQSILFLLSASAFYIPLNPFLQQLLPTLLPTLLPLSVQCLLSLKHILSSIPLQRLHSNLSSTSMIQRYRFWRKYNQLLDGRGGWQVQASRVGLRQVNYELLYRQYSDQYYEVLLQMLDGNKMNENLKVLGEHVVQRWRSKSFKDRNTKQFHIVCKLKQNNLISEVVLKQMKQYNVFLQMSK